MNMTRCLETNHKLRTLKVSNIVPLPILDIRVYINAYFMNYIKNANAPSSSNPLLLSLCAIHTHRPRVRSLWVKKLPDINEVYIFLS